MSRPRQALAGLALAAATAGLAACGTTTVSTSQFSGDSRDVAQTISDLQNDAQGRNEQKICNNDLSSALVSKLTAGGRSCTDVISKQLNEVDNFDLSAAASSDIQVSGTTATARVKSTSGGKSRFDTLTLVKEGTRWKISGLAG